MLKRYRSLRFIFASIAVVAITGFSLALNYRGLKVFGTFDARAEENAVSQAEYQPTLTPGTCDTAGPIEVESSGGTTLPTAYATLKDAFDAVNAGTHTGSISVEVCVDTVETATASLDASGATTASYTDLTIRPVGGARTIEGSLTGAIIKLNGADNVLIDGRQDGTGSARDLSVKNNSNSTGSAAIWLSSLGADAGATNNIIRNLELACGPSNGNSSSTFGIIMSGTSISTTNNGADNDNNQFLFNRIISARYGIVTRGVTTNNNISPVVTDNIIGPDGFGPDEISKTAILMQADTGATVSRNQIQFIGGDLGNSTSGADRVGIAIGSESWSTTASTTITSGDYTVTNNIIHDVVEERTFSAVGILLATTRSGSPTNNLVANNFIYNVRANGTSGDQVTGIGIAGGNADRIVFNSISLTGDMDPGSASASTTFGNAIRIPGANGSNNADFTVMNNSIFVDASSSSTAANRYYAITLNGAGYLFGAGGLNYNNYYINTSNSQVQTGGLGTNTGSSITNQFAALADWQAALTAPQDANSIQSDPFYSSASGDLHINSLSPNIDAGTAITGITTDIDDQARPNGVNPDIGADEFYPAPGELQFSPTSYVGNEGNNVMLSVGRTMGTSGTVTVDVSLTDGTAVGGATCGVGVDYVNPGTQTLTFNDNEANQTLAVMLCSDTDFDPGEMFSAALSNPTGGASIGANSSATVAISDIAPPFNGTVNVGTGENYTSLTNPGGVFEAINNSGAAGNIVINITSDLTGETGVVPLNEIGGGFTLTIKPEGAPRVISGTAATALIKLSGADDVTVDGSMSGGTDRSLTISNSGTGALIWVATNATSGAENNTIKNCIMTGPGGFAGQGVIAGSGGTFGGAAEFPNSNNTIRNNAISRVQNAAFISGNSTTPDQNWTITKNEVGSATAADKLSFRGFFIGNADNFQITENIISGINSSTGTSSTMSGIQINGLINGGLIARNEIKDIRQNNTVGWGSNGVFLTATSTASNLTIANNLISDIASQGFNGSTATDNGYGIMISTGSGYNIYFNTVNMNTDQVATGSITAAVNIAAAVTTAGGVDLRNNILANTQTVGTRYGVFDASTAGAAIFSTIDRNDYFAQNVGFLTSAQATLPEWQAATMQDANSLAVDPVFVSATDLHIQMGSPMIGAGVAIPAITDDFDGDPRPAMNPAIGADEILPQTLEFSSVTYGGDEGNMVTVTVNRTNGATGTVTVDYTLTDGTATGGASCGPGVDYVNPGAQTLSFGDTVTTQTFDVMLCSDTDVDPDETVNLTLSNPTGGAVIGANNPATLTITDVPVTFNGSYDVGPGQTYTSLTNSGGIFEAINTQGASGNIIINITSDLANEDGSVALNEIPGGFSVLIRPAGGSSSIAGTGLTVSGSSTVGIIRLNGADNVTIDGSFNGDTAADVVGGDPSIRNLTIQNTNAAATGGAVVVLNSGTAGAQNNTIKNVNISGQDPVQTLIGIAIGGATVGASGADNDNNRVENCSFRKSFIGIYNAGTSAANPNTGTVITKNDLTGTGTERLRRAGMLFFNHDGLMVSLNSIGGIDTSESLDAYGIGLGIQNSTATTTTAGGIINSTVTRNKISGIVSSSTVGFSAFGIGVAGGTGGANTISNNMVSGVTAPSTSPDLVAGIFVAGTTGSDTRIYHNSIALTGDRGAVANQIGSYGIAITGATPVVELKNNIFFNTQTSGGGANARTYAIGMVASTFANFNSDFNDFFASGANASFFRTGSLSTTGGTQHPNLAAFQAATSTDANSQEVDPLYVNSVNDLHLQQSSPVADDGTPIPTVTVDIDGDARSMVAPEIGADELVAPAGGVLALSSAAYTGGESDATLTVTVNRTGGTAGAVSVDYSLTDSTATGGATCSMGVDYVNTGGTVNFADGEAMQTFNVTICPDAVDEPDETFDIALSNPTGGAVLGTPANAVATITDDDAAPSISVDDVSQNEGNTGTTTFTFTVSLSAPSGQTVMVDYQTADNTATTADNDYVGIGQTTLTFNPGEVSKTVDVTVNGDMTVEPDETFFVNLSNPVNATFGDNQGLGTIINDDFPPQGTLSVDNVRIQEGDSGTSVATFTVTFTPSPTNNGVLPVVSVDYSTADGTALAGSDYMAASGNLVFGSAPLGNGNTQTINVTINGDTTKEQNETFFVNLSNPVNATISDGQGAGIIVDRDRAYVSDFDNDRKSDFTVFRPSTNVWYIFQSTNNIPKITPLGQAGDIPVPGDYDGDGISDVAVFRPAEGNWYILQSQGKSLRMVNWGLAGDKPVQGDYDGDGKTDLAVFRPSEGVWYIFRSSDDTPVIAQFGLGTDIPVTGDFDGDFKNDLIVFRDGVWYVFQSASGSVAIANWGIAGDKPVSGDFDGDGRTDHAVYRDGVWWIFYSLDGNFSAINWGLPTDIPVPADYDGDGTTDVAVFRPSEGNWYVLRSSDSSLSVIKWGTDGDVPAPAAYSPQQ
ncbi:MAG: Calx-beta domain-containing protein [Pyrinomonadaceae bacterium]